MHGKYLKRRLEVTIRDYLGYFPAVAIIGPRQVGKSTLARKIVDTIHPSLYLDLETPADLQKIQDPNILLQWGENRLIVLDEIQRVPEIFPVLRGIIDRADRSGQFLILGSASPDLLKQSSESLAGRIAFVSLSPFDLEEVKSMDTPGSTSVTRDLWIHGGFPRSFLAPSDELSQKWRTDFIRTFLERDIPQLGFRIPAGVLQRFWQMCAHNHGQLFNASKFGESLGVSATTTKTYLDLMEQTFMLRVLRPYQTNLRKRLVKSSKVFLRDSGILHSLLGVTTFDELLGHPSFGSSWEGFAMENILGLFPDWTASFFRTSHGAELDLVLTRGQKRLSFEFKASSAPQLTRGFWNAIEDVKPDHVWVVAPIDESYPLKANVTVCGLLQVLAEATQH